MHGVSFPIFLCLTPNIKFKSYLEKLFKYWLYKETPICCLNPKDSDNK